MFVILGTSSRMYWFQNSFIPLHITCLKNTSLKVCSILIPSHGILIDRTVGFNWNSRSAVLSRKVYRSTGMTRDLVHSDIDFSILASLAANTRTGTEYANANYPSGGFRTEEKERRREREWEREQRHVNILSSAARVHISIRPAGFLLFRRPCSPVVTTRRADPIFDPRGTRWRKSRLSFLHTYARMYAHTRTACSPCLSRNAISLLIARENSQWKWRALVRRAWSELSLGCRILSGRNGFRSLLSIIPDGSRRIFIYHLILNH